MTDGWTAERYARDAAFVPAYGGALVDVLAPRHGERVLDLGCGDGTLSAELAARGAIVCGVDASASMIAAARARGLDVRHVDAHGLDDDARYDAVFSNAALHWMTPLPPVLARVHRALVPGGRFVAELGGFGNCAAIRTALAAAFAEHGLAFHEPWCFPSDATMREWLAAVGFTVRETVAFARPTPLPGGMRAWLDVFVAPFAALPAERTDAVLDRATALLAPVLRDERGAWTADYVRLRFVATR